MKRKPGTALGFMAATLVANQPEHHRPSTIVALNKMGTIAADFNAIHAAFLGDRFLTREGRDVNIAKAATTALASLAAIDVETAKVSDRVAAIEKTLRAKVAPPKDIPAETLREVRDQLRQMSPDERLTIYRTTKDSIVIAAIESAPSSLGSTRSDGTRRFEPYVDATELAAAQMERAEAADPIAATKMRELRDLAEAFRLATNSVRREIMDVAGVTVTAEVQS
jgi:hypothetical protein